MLQEGSFASQASSRLVRKIPSCLKSPGGTWRRFSVTSGLTRKWLPPSGYVPFSENPLQSMKQLILPSLTLGAYLSAIFARFLTSSLADVLSEDYVRTATAKGLRERVVIGRHVMRNALIPVVTMLGIQFGGLLGGAVIVEAIFDWPGLGRLLVTSISSRDYAVVQGTILLAASAFLFVNLLTDLTYGLLDPRIRGDE